MSAANTEPKNERPERDPVLGQILYSIEQAARVLGVSSKLVRVYIDRGELRVRRCGSRVLVHRKELEKFGNHDHDGVAPAVRP